MGNFISSCFSDIDVADKPAMSLKDVLASEKTCVLVVDLQVDFMEGGKLAVGTADYKEYLPKCEAFIKAVREMEPKPYVVFSQDWHPAGHSSFASTHARRRRRRSAPASSRYSRERGSREAARRSSRSASSSRPAAAAARPLRANATAASAFSR